MIDLQWIAGGCLLFRDPELIPLTILQPLFVSVGIGWDRYEDEDEERGEREQKMHLSSGSSS